MDICQKGLQYLPNIPLLQVTTLSQSVPIFFKSPHYTHTHFLQVSSLHPHILNLYISSPIIVPYCILPFPSYPFNSGDIKIFPSVFFTKEMKGMEAGKIAQEFDFFKDDMPPPITCKPNFYNGWTV